MEDRRYRGASAEQRRRRRRELLVEAGLEVFGTTGYRTATVDTLCAEAGLTKRYFYESFPDREALLLAAYEHANGLLRDAVLAAVPPDEPDPLVIARIGLRAAFTCMRDDHRVSRLLYAEILGVSPAADRAYQGCVETWARTIRELVIAGPSGPRTDLLATAAVGAITATAMRWALTGYAEPVDDLVQVVETLLTGTALARGG
ncbi:TetR/AcrR family transcriptional regulator [Spirillospora sp. CA-294931]|uniref:TetR/AcrR family transcriptional regulator n=1 Tax=Spirillospora sp. CA-294931 TaxID=3240042 RepID=UPI003D915A8C